MKIELIQEAGSPFVFLRWGIFCAYLRDRAHSDALGIPFVIQHVPVGTLSSLVRMDDTPFRLAAIAAKVGA